VLVAGLLVFTASSAACALAPSVWWLVAARAAQGLGAALVVPASLALLRAAYSDRRARARAVGLWGAIAGVAAAAGPVLGGVLVTAVGWRAVFVVNVPVGVLGVAAAARYLPSPAPRPAAIDASGQLTAVAAVGLLCAGLICAGDQGWKSPAAVAACLAAGVAAAAFVRLEMRAPEPMLPLHLFAARGFSVGSAVGLLINLGFYGELFVLSLYFQQVRGDTALRSGLALVPLAGALTFASAASGRAVAAVGARAPMFAGLLAGGSGLLALAAAGPETPYALLVAPMVLAGAGMAMTMPAATAAVLDAAPGSQAGIAAGTVNAARQVGGVVGVALLGTIVQAGAHATAGGTQAAGVLAASAFLIGAVLVARFLRPGALTETTAARRRRRGRARAARSRRPERPC